MLSHVKRIIDLLSLFESTSISDLYFAAIVSFLLPKISIIDYLLRKTCVLDADLVMSSITSWYDELLSAKKSWQTPGSH
jgi:hypothetical protein